MISACLSAGKKVIPTTSKKGSGEQKIAKPGWNDYCREKREIAMYWHELWKSEGRPHNTFSSIMRRKSRLQYHYAVKCIVKNKDSIKKKIWLKIV